MTFDEFRRETGNLESFYEKAYNSTQMQIWYEELREYTIEKYKQAIKHICKTSQYRPTLSLVIETIRKVKHEEKPREQYECKACHSTGIIFYKKVIEGLEYEYACQCNCPNAIGLDYDGTKIADKEHRSQYYLAKGVDVFRVGGVK